MATPDLAITYNENLPSDLFEEFKDSISSGDLCVAIEAREEDGPYACPEWFILTAAAVFIGKSYFDGVNTPLLAQPQRRELSHI